MFRFYFSFCTSEMFLSRDLLISKVSNYFQHSYFVPGIMIISRNIALITSTIMPKIYQRCILYEGTCSWFQNSHNITKYMKIKLQFTYSEYSNNIIKKFNKVISMCMNMCVLLMCLKA